MKMPIEWHKQCLENSKKNLAVVERQILIQMNGFSRMQDQVIFAEEQIQAAEKKGLDGFDDERFMKKRKGE